MSRLTWDEVGDRVYETGVDRGVLYPAAVSAPGVPWNGLVSIQENPSGGDIEPLYYDGVKYLDFVAAEDFSATLEAFSCPVEFNECDGNKTLSPGLFATQQPRKTFGLSYRTLIGNDLDGIEHGYKLHLVYGCTAAPSPRTSGTLSGTPNPSTRSWNINTVPAPAETYKPTAHFVIDSRHLNPYTLQDLESYLYGRDGQDPRLPTQDEVILILANPVNDTITATI